MAIDKTTGLWTPQASGGGGDGGDFYLCTNVDVNNKLWSGNKLDFVDDIYIPSNTEITNLTYTNITPKIGKYYSSNCLAEIKPWLGAGVLPTNVPMDGLLAWYPLTMNANDVYGGHNDSVIYGDIDFSNGYATNFSSSNYIVLEEDIVPNGQTEWTVGMFMQLPTRSYNVQLGEVILDNSYNFAFQDNGGWYHFRYQNNEWSAVSDYDFSNWCLVVATNNPSDGTFKMYGNTTLKRTDSSKNISISRAWSLGCYFNYEKASSVTPSDTKLKHLFFYDRALSQEEISTIYQSAKED